MFNQRRKKYLNISKTLILNGKHHPFFFNFYILCFSLGIAFDPMDTKPIPDVYFSACLLFHGGILTTSGPTINGRIMKASGPSLNTLTTVISGLPVSDLDHALNAMVFGDNGELYFNSGSHTNGGIKGKSSKSQLLKENFLSAAVNVAYLSHPDFNGNIKWSALDDGDLIATGIDNYAVGLRNPYGLLMHSNLNLYATDNGPNYGYGKMMTGCGPNDFIEDQKRNDELNLLKKGSYHGHPNPKRATYLKDKRQCEWHGPEDISTAEYTAPIATATSSRDGIVEFHSNHFGGQMRGNIIAAWHSKVPSLSRIILNADGSGVVPESKIFLPLNIGDAALDVTQAPNGNLIEMRFERSQLAAQIPVEAATTVMSIKTVFPYRGPDGGGNTLSIYGINFGTNPIITVGNGICRFLSASSTSKRIDCVLPGGTGTVDVTVTFGTNVSTFAKGYRYIPGVTPRDFILPVYPRK